MGFQYVSIVASLRHFISHGSKHECRWSNPPLTSVLASADDNAKLAHRGNKIKGNDLQIYDTQDPWWAEGDTTLTPLRRLVPARVRFLEKSVVATNRVLDVGCGGGYMIDAIARENLELVGIDLAQQALVAAHTRALQQQYDAKLMRASALNLPFADDAFDGVVCTDVLVHVPNPRRVVAEISRVLKPGGWLHFSSINRNWLAHFIMITLGENWLKMVPKGTHDSATFIKPKELRAMLADSGLHLERWQGLGPVGWSLGAFTFGGHPLKTVMYQGVAKRIVPPDSLL